MLQEKELVSYKHRIWNVIDGQHRTAKVVELISKGVLPDDWCFEYVNVLGFDPSIDRARVMAVSMLFNTVTLTLHHRPFPSLINSVHYQLEEQRQEGDFLDKLFQIKNVRSLCRTFGFSLFTTHTLVVLRCLRGHQESGAGCQGQGNDKTTPRRPRQPEEEGWQAQGLVQVLVLLS